MASERAGSPSPSLATDINAEQLQETIRWPYEEEELLECIDREELPLVLVDMCEAKCPGLFYSGCVIAEIRDYRQSFPIFTCDTYHVLLKPTNQVSGSTAGGCWQNIVWQNGRKLNGRIGQLAE